MNRPFLDVAEGGYPAGRLSTSSLITESGGERTGRFRAATYGKQPFVQLMGNGLIGQLPALTYAVQLRGRVAFGHHDGQSCASSAVLYPVDRDMAFGLKRRRTGGLVPAMIHGQPFALRRADEAVVTVRCHTGVGAIYSTSGMKTRPTSIRQTDPYLR